MARILVVDDSPTEKMALQQLLRKHGHQVTVADDGAKGVQAAREQHPDLILMDVVMPVLNGYQATRQLSKSADTSHIPVVMISSKTQESDRYWGMRQGAKAYLCKPATEDEIMQVVSGLLN